MLPDELTLAELIRRLPEMIATQLLLVAPLLHLAWLLAQYL